MNSDCGATIWEYFVVIPFGLFLSICCIFGGLVVYKIIKDIKGNDI